MVMVNIKNEVYNVIIRSIDDVPGFVNRVLREVLKIEKTEKVKKK